MRRLLLLLLMPLMVVAAMAQRNVTGIVVENETGDALPQTTVKLLRTDSTLVKGALTGLDGKFELKAPSAGKYIVQVTCVGFKPYTKNLSVSGDKNVALGTIAMKPDAIMLKGATVTGQAAKVTLKADTFVYNASAYRTPEGSVVEELVKRLPGAQVDDNGKITINGKEVKKIMVDGKEFMTGDTKTAMKNLPTSIIERVRAYDQKSDLARVSGIDDGEEETVLDFGIKQGMNKGLMLNADLAKGTKDRYSGRIFGGWMKDNTKIFLMSSANNVNDMGPQRRRRYHTPFHRELHEQFGFHLRQLPERQHDAKQQLGCPPATGVDARLDDEHHVPAQFPIQLQRRRERGNQCHLRCRSL